MGRYRGGMPKISCRRGWEAWVSQYVDVTWGGGTSYGIEYGVNDHRNTVKAVEIIPGWVLCVSAIVDEKDQN